MMASACVVQVSCSVTQHYQKEPRKVMTAALALNRGATQPTGKRFCKVEDSTPQGDLSSSENLRLNKKCFNQALLPTGLSSVTKSDIAESTYQQIQKGYRQNLRFGLYSALCSINPQHQFQGAAIRCCVLQWSLGVCAGRV
jgi:hypothetical protein